MKNIIKYSVLLASVLLSGCATQAFNTFQPFQATPIDLNSPTVKYTQKTDILHAIIDSSGTTGEAFEGAAYAVTPQASKLAVEKEILSRMNKTIPDITLNAGIRSFGFGPCLDWQRSKLNLNIGSYNKSSFAGGIDNLTCSGGGTPLHRAIELAGEDLASTTGNVALLIMSDGLVDSSPILAMQDLKAKYGERLCVYSVWIGNDKDARGRYIIQKLPDVAGCGFNVAAADIASSSGMNNFVERILFNRSNIIPAGPLDSDGDGVLDKDDKCPDTPKGAVVGKNGCWAYHGVLFDFDKDTIKPEYHSLFQNAVKVMNENPGLTVEIEGHTDSIGSAEYNQNLSERRARSVKSHLVVKGIDATRMTTKGLGEAEPVANNRTEEGRAQNRRVDFEITNR
jgi:OOP family OmpA-OmpF porin